MTMLLRRLAASILFLCVIDPSVNILTRGFVLPQLPSVHRISRHSAAYSSVPRLHLDKGSNSITGSCLYGSSKPQERDPDNDKTENDTALLPKSEKKTNKTKETTTKDKKKSKEPNDDDDLPSWVRAIRQWTPTTTTTTTTSSSTEASSDPLRPETIIKTENETSSGGWLLDPILQSLGNVQELLSSLDKNDDKNNKSDPAAPRNFLDLLVDQNADGTTKPSMESILDSLEGAALIVNVSAAAAAASTTTLNDNNATTTVDQFWDNGWNRWDRWMTSMQQALSSNNKSSTATPTATATDLTAAAESILRQATSRLERFLPDAVVPATPLQSVLEMTNATTTALALAAVAEQSLDLNETANVARQLGSFAGQLKGVADGLLRQGYVSSSLSIEGITTSSTKQPASSNRTYRVAMPSSSSKTTKRGALFENFVTASELDRYTPILGQAAEMAAMSGLIYEQTVPRARQLGHSIVARGCTSNVKWLVTDSLASHSALELYKDRIDNDPSETPLLIRTITIRGFDASDEDVDRETLVTQVCTANQEPLNTKQFKHLKVHGGLWQIAKAIYQDVKQYIDWTTDDHKIVLSGHSVGGSLANMILFLLTLERGADFVQDRILRVYTFGSPPIAALSADAPSSSTKRGGGRGSSGSKSSSSSTSSLRCEILEALGLPSNLVWAFVQPWDPICRLFSDIDVLYPLIGDMGPGSDGITPWPNGPPRTLRAVLKAILEAWEGWPRFRDSWYETGAQSYGSVGIQHILLPEATRYLTDRFLTVSIAVPPVRSILRISGHELYPALVAAFPLDVFEISYVPQAIRGFVHHFYPAYGFPLVEYVRLLEERAEPLLVRDNLASAWSSTDEDMNKDGADEIDATEAAVRNGSNTSDQEVEESTLWDSLASPWLSSRSRREVSNATATTSTTTTTASP